eukprot:c9972_g1_i2.p1 GENE.c9972_g1_i2~~c9972_g1_i2.p1  ORF type:complete len:394 (-),score=76.26 c9972_g1_i2:106-1287(-)
MMAFLFLQFGLLVHAREPWTSNIQAQRIALSKIPVQPPKFTIDLDKPGLERWDHIAPQFRDKSEKLVNYARQVIPPSAQPVIEQIAGNISHYFRDYVDEMHSLARGLNISLGNVVLLNLVYQFETLRVNCSSWNTTGPTPDCPPDGPEGYCTSIIAKDSSGSIIHGRNLDWDFTNDMLDFVMEIEFQRNNTVVMTSNMIVGSVGVLNAVSSSKVGVSINARNRGGVITLNLLQMLSHKAFTPDHLARYALENAKNFSEAISLLSSKPLINDIYYTVSGTTDGAIITRDRNRAVDVWYLNGTSKHDWREDAQEPWFKLQTNRDHWEAENPADTRRAPGVHHMEQFRDEMDDTAMYAVLTSWPVFNHHTDFSAIYHPADGKFMSYVWRIANNSRV